MKVSVYDRSNVASLGSRVAAAILDSIFMGIIIFIIHLTCGQWAGVLGIVTAIHYDIGMHHLKGGTLGQVLIGIRVVSLNGTKLGLWQNIVRFLSKSFASLTLGVGFFIAVRNERKMAWHDSIAGTCVVLKGAMPISEIEIKRQDLVRTGLFLTLFTGLVLSFAGLILYIMTLTSESPAYEPAREAILIHPVITDSVGTIGALRMVYFRFKSGTQGTTWWYKTKVFGSRANATVATTVFQNEESCQLKFIGFLNQDGNVVSLREWGKSRAIDLAKIGDQFGVLDQTDSAIFYYTRSIQYDSSCFRAWYGRSAVYISLGQYRDALADATQAVLIDPDSKLARYRRGLSCQEAGFYQRALNDFEYLIRWNDQDKRAYLNKARALDSLGRRREAAFNYEEFLRLANDSDSIFIASAKHRISELKSIP